MAKNESVAVLNTQKCKLMSTQSLHFWMQTIKQTNEAKRKQIQEYAALKEKPMCIFSNG